MKYPHTVKHDGVWYPAGAEVPVGMPKSVETKAPQPVEVEEEPQTPTRTEITRLNRSEAAKMASEHGIAVNDERTAREIKKELVKKLGL